MDFRNSGAKSVPSQFSFSHRRSGLVEVQEALALSFPISLFTTLLAMNEQQRIGSLIHDEPAPLPSLRIAVEQLPDPARCLARVQEIILGVLAVPEDLWQEGYETQWEAYLPAWFVTSMTQYTVAQIMNLPDQWHFESWVSTIIARQWQWWSSAVGDRSLHLNVELWGEPYNIEPLFYAIHASAGGAYRLTSVVSLS
ncbi:hypothetical protein F0P96_18645 [Hymenobacter busanensis]|uniref:Uncharacterized protein n=1 Tax=Hymenobacter busanensis TaxID=2607656 RepID=A0A7L4ZT14_9BACT|nr:hypothetical protein [Hymenobacter busanensis]KAA9327251.1 hypothetical protein F0P96_18645 [Hymenobacter busanensis]QHJ05916.1 hypothetical protein GUY19_00850 [Hymenobacter busanensis]